jgi:hypothetical protein
VASVASAAQIGHDHFVSDPYADNWCGIDGTSVDDVVANSALDDSRSNINVKTIYTATASGKSMEIFQEGAWRSGPQVDNGDGTYSVTFSNSCSLPPLQAADRPGDPGHGPARGDRNVRRGDG